LNADWPESVERWLRCCVRAPPDLIEQLRDGFDEVRFVALE
jgi:hypothetical protein